MIENNIIELIYQPKRKRVNIFSEQIYDETPFENIIITVDNNISQELQNTINVNKGVNVHVTITEFKKLENVSFMFEDTSLLSIPENYIWDMSMVTDMSSMILNFSLLESIPAIENWNTSNVKNMSNLFKG